MAGGFACGVIRGARSPGVLFGTIQAVDFDGSRLLFRADDTGGESGVYLIDDGALEKVADTTDFAAGGAKFRSFDAVSLDGNTVAFEGTWGSSPFKTGICLWAEGELHEVVDTLDTLDGTGVDGHRREKLRFRQVR